MYSLPLFKYPSNWVFQRTPARPKDLWVFDFEKNYDWDNLWYDAVQINPDTILLIGPPLYGTKDYITSNCKIVDKHNNILPFSFYEMDRVCITIVKAQGFLDSVMLIDQTAQHPISISQTSFDFQNKKTIVTISKDHPIEWLEQWIDYHVTIHNVEGFIIYNNQSTAYSSQDLQTQLNREDVKITVVDYNVPFGCMGGGDWEWNGKRGTYLPWDSDFSQYIMLEHAKWKFLHCASLAINADTDELLIIKNDTLDAIADYCKNNNSVWLYKGIWIEPVDKVTGQEACDIPYIDRKFWNYNLTTNSTQRGIGIKWLLNPSKNINYQWMLHRITGPQMETSDIYFAHFLSMNTSWSWPRDKFTGNKADLAVHKDLDKNLNNWINKSKRYKNEMRSSNIT